MQITILLILLINLVFFGIDGQVGKKPLCISSNLVHSIDIARDDGTLDRIYGCASLPNRRSSLYPHHFSADWFFWEPSVSQSLAIWSLRFQEIGYHPEGPFRLKIKLSKELSNQNSIAPLVDKAIYEKILQTEGVIAKSISLEPHFWIYYWNLPMKPQSDKIISFYRDLPFFERRKVLTQLISRSLESSPEYLKWFSSQIRQAKKLAAKTEVIYFSDPERLVDVRTQSLLARHWTWDYITFKRVYIFNTDLSLSKLSAVPVRAQFVSEITMDEKEFIKQEKIFEKNEYSKNKVVSLFGLVHIPFLRPYLRSIDPQIQTLPMAAIEALAQRKTNDAQTVYEFCSERPEFCKALDLPIKKL